MLTRTINSDAVLAEQLLHELKRRQVDLKPCADRRCNPRVALISEWDTPYGRALPRTLAAVVMNKGSGETGPDLKAEIDKLRRDEWPAGSTALLSGRASMANCRRAREIRATSSKDSSPNKASALLGSQPHSAERNTAPRPEGRGQLGLWCGWQPPSNRRNQERGGTSRPSASWEAMFTISSLFCRRCVPAFHERSFSPPT